MSAISHRFFSGIGPRFLALVAICALIYWPGLGGAFFFDDGPSIVSAPGIKLEYLSWENLLQAWSSGGAGPTGRPLAQLSFAINYYFSAFNPFAFKATNLAIHCACGALVYGLSRRILITAHTEYKFESHQYIALAIAAAWLLHPIQLLPVLHVAQRMTSLSALFLFAAMYMHIVGREHQNGASRTKIFIAWLVLWPMSIFSKETGILFPLFAVSWELIVRKTAMPRLDRFAQLMVVAIVLISIAATFYLSSNKAQWLWAGYEMRPFDMLQRVMTEARVLWFYLGQIFFPRLGVFGLYHDDFALSTGWSAPWTTLPSILGLSVLSVVSWCLRKRAPLLTFGMSWFFVGHLIESTVLPLELVHEHRNYVPMMGIPFVVFGAWHAVYGRYTKGSPISIGLAMAMLCSLSFVTALRSHQFGDEIRRTQMAVYQHSSSAQAHYEAGSTLATLVNANDVSATLVARTELHLKASMDLNPNFKLGALSLLYLRCKVGMSPNPDDLFELMRRLRSTPFAPADRNVLYTAKEMANNGESCLNREQIDGLFVAAISNPTVSAYVKSILLSWHADYLWLTAKDMGAARDALSQSLAIYSTSPSNLLKWAQLLYISGEFEIAGRTLRGLKDSSLSGEERRTKGELLRSLNIE